MRGRGARRLARRRARGAEAKAGYQCKRAVRTTAAPRAPKARRGGEQRLTLMSPCTKRMRWRCRSAAPTPASTWAATAASSAGARPGAAGRISPELRASLRLP